MTATYLIKKYANRKLYDTVERRYVTLDVVADLARRGTSIQVVDQPTGNDITDATLALASEPTSRPSGAARRPRPATPARKPSFNKGDAHAVKNDSALQSLVRASLALPLALTQRAIDGFGGRPSADTAEIVEELEDLRAEVAVLSHEVERLLGEVAELRPVRK